jgi:hypothetical protein
MLLTLPLMATLAGCSRPGELVTRRPLLNPPDAAGAPKFRSGVWRLIWPNTADNPCPFDETQPIKAWPSCDAPEVVAPDHMVAIADLKTPFGSRLIERRRPYILAAGPMLVLQLYSDAYAGRYSYDAVDQVTLDDAGRIIAARLTPINCFDPAAFTAAMEWQANSVTEDNTHPIEDPPTGSVQPSLAPGIIRAFGGECRPRGLAALRSAASVDAAASTERVNFRWVRDGAR